MSVKDSISRVIATFGSSVSVERKDRRIETKAFVQPMRRRHRPYINEKALPAGYFENGYRLYVGEADVPLFQSDIIKMGNERFSVVMSEGFFFRDENLYIWGILQEAAPLEEDDDDTT